MTKLLPQCRLGGLIAFAVIVLGGRDCFPEGTRKILVYVFIFSQIGIQALTFISEALVAFISSRGSITIHTAIDSEEPRPLLPHFLRIRAVLYALEILSVVLGGYIAWNPYIQDHIHCERSNRVSQAIEAYVISVIVVHVIIAILFMIYFDPLGLQTPSLLRELDVFVGHEDNGGGDNKGDKTQHKNQNEVSNKKGLYRTSTWKFWGRRAKLLCCCVRGNNNTSKAQALDDIAHAMATIFDDLEIVPTDFIAALMLVHRDQKEQMTKDPECDLGAQLKRVSKSEFSDFITDSYL